MNIGQAANASGVSAKMIRYYEKIGLIEAAERTASGYRVYSDGDVHTLSFIRRARDLGFSVEQIAELLALWKDRNRASSDVRQLALDHVDRLGQKVAEIQAMIVTLRDLADSCAADSRPECPILRDLAEGSEPDAGGRPENRFGVARLR